MRTMLILLMMANAADAGLTIRNYDQGGFREANPVLRPIARRGPRAIGITFAAASVGEWWGIGRIGKRHPRLGVAIAESALGGEAWGITVSGRDVSRRPR